MGKLVFWIVVAFVVLFAVRLYGAAQAKKRRERDAAHGAAGPMVRCTNCGVFVPKADAVKGTDGYWCRNRIVHTDLRMPARGSEGCT